MALRSWTEVSPAHTARARRLLGGGTVSKPRGPTHGAFTTSTVAQLGVRVTFSTGVTAGHEAAPLVVTATMYIVTPWPNILYALDLTKPGAPVKFAYEPKPRSRRPKVWPAATW